MTASATVIIPTHSGGERIGSLLDSLDPNRSGDQVLVVDNGSTDRTPEVLAAHPEVEVISPGRNLGFGAAVNLAVRRAESDALVLVNDDCLCDPGFVAAIAAELGGDVAMAAGILRDQADPARIDTAGMELDSTLLVFDYLHGEPPAAAEVAPDPIGPCAAAAAFDRSAFLEVGGFDEALFAYWEDVDLVLRMRLAGHTCALARGATGTHAHSATLGPGSREKNALTAYGRGYVLRKWSVLHGRRALLALGLDAVICVGQAVSDRTLTGVGARIRGYRSAPAAYSYPETVLAGHRSARPKEQLARRWRRRRRLRRRKASPRAPTPEEAEIERQLSVSAPIAAPGPGEIRAVLTTPIPEPLRIGRGNAILVGGRLGGTPDPRASLKLTVDGETSDAPVHRLRLRPRSWVWWTSLVLEGDRSDDRVRLALATRAGDGRSTIAELGEIRVESGNGRAPGAAGAAIHAAGAESGPMVAICMATHQPRLALLRAQLRSIQAQTHRAWICLISDDCSDRERLDEIQALIADDPRFVLLRHRDRVGFYRNYERALAAVPPATEFVALSDQDDVWRPEKLELLLEQIGDAALSYGDMRVVDESGEVLSETYWTRRRNNHTDLASLVVGNTVTGAASLFRTSLLDRALPFPPARGRAYHDHWIALTALTSGGIAYVDRPIQDYLQHAGASQGHAEANAGADYLNPRSLVPLAWRALLAIVGARSSSAWASRYFGMHARTQLWARLLIARCGDSLDHRQQRVLARIADAERSPLALAWLAARSLRPVWGANEAFGRELILLSSVIWCRTRELRSRLAVALTGAEHGR